MTGMAQSLFSVQLPPLGNISTITAEQQHTVWDLFEMCGPALPPIKLLSDGHLAMVAMAHLCGVSSCSELQALFHDDERVKQAQLLPNLGDDEVICRFCKRQLHFFWATAHSGEGMEVCWSCVPLVDNPEQHTLFHNLSKHGLQSLDRLFQTYSTYRVADYVQLPVQYALTEKPHIQVSGSWFAFRSHHQRYSE